MGVPIDVHRYLEFDVILLPHYKRYLKELTNGGIKKPLKLFYSELFRIDTVLSLLCMEE